MTTVNIYLTFDGNCEEAFNFYRAAFRGEFSYISKFKDMPRQEGLPPMPAELGEKIMHVSLPVSDETLLMGCDTGGEWASSFVQGNNFSISVSTGTKAEADRLFLALSAGGKVTIPLNVTFWGEYFGMFTDKFGINWMVSHRMEQK